MTENCSCPNCWGNPGYEHGQQRLDFAGVKLGGDTVKQVFLDNPQKELDPDFIAETTELPIEKVEKYIKKLSKQGEIFKVSSGKWGLLT